MTNVTWPIKDISISRYLKVTKCKLGYPDREFQKANMGLAYIINKTELYDAIDIIGKLLNFSE